jgi:hypothetical protein
VSPKRGSLAGMLSPAPGQAPPRPPRKPDADRERHPTADVQSPEVQTPEVAGVSSRQPSRGVAGRGRESRTPEVQSPEVQTPGLPKYLRLERKELLIWPDQITQLSILARRLNRSRGRAGERITTNTLLRVAAALLLSRSQELAGSTEGELRQSLGLPDQQSGS